MAGQVKLRAKSYIRQALECQTVENSEPFSARQGLAEMGNMAMFYGLCSELIYFPSFL